jgi:anti-sigma B factor antagonist
MSLSAKTRQSNGIIIVDLEGRITLGEATGLLRDTVKTVLAEGHKDILLNLGQVSYIDSAGLGELVGCSTTVRNAGGRLKLMQLQKKISDLMQITKLHTVFEVIDDEAKAVASFPTAGGAAS